MAPVTADTPHSDRAHRASRNPLNRSSVSNGTKLWPPGIDGRTREARRWRDAHADLAEALGHEPTVAERALLRRAASLTVACERLDADLAAGEPVDPDRLVRLSNGLGRALMALGLVTWSDRHDKPQEPEDPAAHLARIRDPGYWKDRT